VITRGKSGVDAREKRTWKAASGDVPLDGKKGVLFEPGKGTAQLSGNSGGRGAMKDSIKLLPIDVVEKRKGKSDNLDRGEEDLCPRKKSAMYSARSPRILATVGQPRLEAEIVHERAEAKKICARGGGGLTVEFSRTFSSHWRKHNLPVPGSVERSTKLLRRETGSINRRDGELGEGKRI